MTQESQRHRDTNEPMGPGLGEVASGAARDFAHRSKGLFSKASERLTELRDQARAQEPWTPGKRTLTGAAGLGLVTLAATLRRFWRAGLGFAGLGLILRSLTHRPTQTNGKHAQHNDTQRGSFTMKCEELMKRAVESITPKDTVQTAAVRMRDRNIGFLPICDESSVVLGTVTDRDLAIRVLAEGLGPDTIVEEIFSGELIACRPEDDVSKAQELMARFKKSRIVVTDPEGKLVGIISLSDLAQRLPDSHQTLRDISEREARA